MSKAVLVLDEMPAGCPTCQLCHLSVNYNVRMCGAAKLEMAAEQGIYERRDDCPLRVMPPEAVPDNSDMPIMWNVGWNACLNAIEGK